MRLLCVLFFLHLIFAMIARLVCVKTICTYSCAACLYFECCSSIYKIYFLTKQQHVSCFRGHLISLAKWNLGTFLWKTAEADAPSATSTTVLPNSWWTYCELSAQLYRYALSVLNCRLKSVLNIILLECDLTFISRFVYLILWKLGRFRSSVLFSLKLSR